MVDVEFIPLKPSPEWKIAYLLVISRNACKASFAWVLSHITCFQKLVTETYTNLYSTMQSKLYLPFRNAKPPTLINILSI